MASCYRSSWELKPFKVRRTSTMEKKIVLVGESNPYGSDPYYALYPAPDGCSGHRLCTMILGMGRAEYMETFDRMNLCTGKWSMTEARRTANSVRYRYLVLLGAKVCSAFSVKFIPFADTDVGFGELGEFTPDAKAVILPHPSGLCRLWNDPGSYERARAAVARLAARIK